MSWVKASFVGYDNPVVVDRTFKNNDDGKFIAACRKIAKSTTLKVFTKWTKENIVVKPERVEELYNELRK